MFGVKSCEKARETNDLHWTLGMKSSSPPQCLALLARSRYRLCLCFMRIQFQGKYRDANGARNIKAYGLFGCCRGGVRAELGAGGINIRS